MIPSKRKRILSFVAAVLVLVVAGYCLWWNQLASRLRDGLVEWAAGAKASGWDVSLGPVSLGGFPLHVVLSVAAPRATNAEGYAWTGSPSTITLSPLDLTVVHLDTKGPQTFVMAGGAPLPVAVGAAHWDVWLVAGRPARVSLAAEDIGAQGFSLSRLTAHAEWLATGKVDDRTAQASLAVESEHLVLPKIDRLPFGNVIPKLAFQVRLMGSLGTGRLDEALAQWRDGGGTLEIDSFALSWPPLDLHGKGTLALDGDMQPMLASSCSVGGLFAALDQMSGKGDLRPQDVGMIKLALGLMMKPAADGRQILTVPLTVQNKTLSLGSIPLFPLPTVSWR